MPRSIKVRMSKDELCPFDRKIKDIYKFDDEDVKVVIGFSDDETEIFLSERDCEDIIQFIRRNRL